MERADCSEAMRDPSCKQCLMRPGGTLAVAPCLLLFLEIIGKKILVVGKVQTLLLFEAEGLGKQVLLALLIL